MDRKHIIDNLDIQSTLSKNKFTGIWKMMQGFRSALPRSSRQPGRFSCSKNLHLPAFALFC